MAGRPKTPISTSLNLSAFFLAPIELSVSQSVRQSNPQFEIGREIIPSSFSIDRSTEQREGALLPSSALRRAQKSSADCGGGDCLRSAALIFFSFLPPSSSNLPRLIPFPPTDRASKTLHGVHWFCDAAQARSHNLISLSIFCQ